MKTEPVYDIEMSFSQMQDYRLCPRKWAFSKVDKLKGIPSLAAIRGVRYHSVLEKKIKAKEFHSSNEIIQRGLTHLTNSTSIGLVQAEKYIEHIEAGVKVRGYIDVFTSKGRQVIDWKFPVKKPSGCKKDHKRQLNLYALLTGAKSCQVVFPEYDKAYRFDADEAIGQGTLDDCIKAAVEIRQTKANEISGFDTEARPNYLCGKYCSFRGICPFGGEQ